VAQVVDPEFKPQYSKGKKEGEREERERERERRERERGRSGSAPDATGRTSSN
jgi:hypothetical protein